MMLAVSVIRVGVALQSIVDIGACSAVDISAVVPVAVCVGSGHDVAVGDGAAVLVSTSVALGVVTIEVTPGVVTTHPDSATTTRRADMILTRITPHHFCLNN